MLLSNGVSIYKVPNTPTSSKTTKHKMSQTCRQPLPTVTTNADLPTSHSPNKQTQLSLETHKRKKKTEQTTTRSTIRLYLLVFKTNLEHNGKECQHFPNTHYSQLLQINDQFSILYWKPKRNCSLQMHMRRRHIAYPPYGHSHTRSRARRPRK